jgi:hypothetical protein
VAAAPGVEVPGVLAELGPAKPARSSQVGQIWSGCYSCSLGEDIDGCLVEGGGFAQGCRVRSGEFGEPGAQDPVVDAGEEHGVPESGAGDLVALGVRMRSMRPCSRSRRRS